MALDIEEMVAKFRRDMDDLFEPYLWSDDEILDYLDEAQDEFTELVDVLADELTIPFVATDTSVQIPDYVTRLRSGQRPSGRKLLAFNLEEFQEAMMSDDYGVTIPSTNWEVDTDVEPKAVITDLITGSYRLYPIPTQDGSLKLQVFRRAKESLLDGAELEVTERNHQKCVLLKARSIAYLKQDSETYDRTESESLDARFLHTAQELQDRVYRKRRRARSVTYGGL